MTSNVRKDPEVKELSISAQLKEVRTFLNIKICQEHFFLRIRYGTTMIISRELNKCYNSSEWQKKVGEENYFSFFLSCNQSLCDVKLGYRQILGESKYYISLQINKIFLPVLWIRIKGGQKITPTKIEKS